jgi:hypothetical protein
MTVFAVDGPRDVPSYHGKAGGRTITDDNVREFWKANHDLTKRRGCYAFGIRAGKGFTVGYVGKATKGFKGEVFAHHKLTRYQQFLADYRKGTPVLFFLVVPRSKGAPNNKHIGQLEDFLIQTGVRANPHLLNIKGTAEEEWGIGGLLRSGHGKPSKAAKLFKSFMKM